MKSVKICSNLVIICQNLFKSNENLMKYNVQSRIYSSICRWLPSTVPNGPQIPRHIGGFSLKEHCQVGNEPSGYPSTKSQTSLYFGTGDIDDRRCWVSALASNMAAPLSQPFTCLTPMPSPNSSTPCILPSTLKWPIPFHC